MNGRIAALLLSWVMVFSLIVLIIELAPVVTSSDIIYVDDVPGVGPDNPAENYTSIQVAIDAAKDGDTVYVYSGRYLENVVVNKTINLTGEDRDNTTIEGVIGEVVRVRFNWVNVSGFTIINGNEGIDLLGVQNCRIFNNTIHSNNNNGISLFGSFGNIITGNTALNNNKGISLYISSGNNITDNTASSNDIGISLSGSWGNWIVDNNASNNENGIMLHDSNDNTLMNNNFSSNSRIGIWLEGSARNNITGSTMIEDGIHIRGQLLEHWNTHQIDTSNTVNGKPVYYWKNQNGGTIPPGAGEVILANCINVRIEGQDVSDGSVGILLGFSNNNYIANNTASSNRYNIELSFSEYNTLTNNTVSHGGIGFYFYYSSNNTLTGNKMSCNSAGIVFFWCDYNTIANNDVSSNLVNGISINFGLGNIIKDNTLPNNRDGIRLSSSDENEIIGNTISNNGEYGLHISDSSRNRIYHNNFIDNVNQAYDNMDDNFWNESYPSGGNYWSDFDEPGEGAYDDFNGSDQNILGSDGIVDSGLPAGGKNPYVIDADSRDNYPLINLTKNFIFLYPGWNLISIPRIQIETNPGTVLSPISGSYRTIQWYNSSDPDDPWKHNSTTKPQHLNDFDSIDHLIGFWIYITEPGGVLLEYSGQQPGAPENIALHTGWNMVGFPSLSNKNRTAALNNLDFGVEVDAIWTFDAATQTWEEVGSGDDFKIGKGYWMHATQECVWEVPL